MYTIYKFTKIQHFFNTRAVVFTAIIQVWNYLFMPKEPSMKIALECDTSHFFIWAEELVTLIVCTCREVWPYGTSVTSCLPSLLTHIYEFYIAKTWYLAVTNYIKFMEKSDSRVLVLHLMLKYNVVASIQSSYEKDGSVRTWWARKKRCESLSERKK